MVSGEVANSIIDLLIDNLGVVLDEERALRRTVTSNIDIKRKFIQE